MYVTPHGMITYAIMHVRDPRKGYFWVALQLSQDYGYDYDYEYVSNE
jgi:hypothetical protein